MANQDESQEQTLLAQLRLVRQARSGDREAQQQLWCEHRRWVAAIILAHRPQSVEVDDLLQEVAVKMVSKLETLRDEALFRPWLRQIVINVCRGTARSLKPTLYLAASDLSDDSPREAGRVAVPAALDDGLSRSFDQHEAAARLMQQVLSLPPEYREPLLLRCVRNMTYQQISELLDLPVTTIETRLAPARRMLRQEAGEEVCLEEMT